MKGLLDRPVTLLVLAFLTLAGMALYQTNRLDSAESITLRALLPAGSTLATFGNRISNIYETARNLDSLRQKNVELQERVDALTIENVRLHEAELQNTTLREQLNFRESRRDLKVLSADVIGRDPNNLQQSLLINLGAEDGIKAGMPVITSRGLVGRIIRVGQRSSKILLVNDPSSSVTAMVQGSRATGILDGQIGGPLRLTQIPPNDDVRPGDIILTSGLGGNFPKGLIIGQVTSVKHRDVDVFQEAEVQATVDFSRLELVMIVTNFTPADDQSQFEDQP
ncbi:MAG: rod shape-determining protein MreC [Chloroflexi bacterium]|nr:rod shape-determining protein MreC [Chloroflexota bacterium]